MSHCSYYDVIIVGGSCAGAAAGYILSKAGKRILIIDKAVFPRDKLCGGMLTEKTVKLLTSIYKELSLPYIIDSSYNTFGIYDAKSGFICKYTDPLQKLFFVDRKLFDNYFLEQAVAQGCSLITGQKVIKIDKSGVYTDAGEVFFADIIIGADGAYSIVRKLVSNTIRNDHYSFAVNLNVNYDDMIISDNEEINFPKIYFNFMNFGYGWVFPKKNYVTIGLGGLVNQNNNNIKELFDLFYKTICKTNNKLNLLKGFPVPLHNFIKCPAKENIILVGDAAGLIEPITGEGIYFAILSGQIAAEAILSKGDFRNNYNFLINKRIVKVLNQAYFMKNMLFNHYLLNFALKKMKGNIRYAKYYFDLLSGNIDYIQYIKVILRDKYFGH